MTKYRFETTGGVEVYEADNYLGQLFLAPMQGKEGDIIFVVKWKEAGKSIRRLMTWKMNPKDKKRARVHKPNFFRRILNI